MEKADRFALSKGRTQTSDKLLSEDEIRRLYHELEVHQIELLTQNDELQIAKENAESVSAKYSALYDFSPSGYFTLNQHGIILELNLNAARLLNNDRYLLTQQDFNKFIYPSDRIIFQNFISDIYKTGIKQSCELRLPRNQDNEVYIHMEGIAAEYDTCIISTVDISQHRKTENALRESESQLQDLNATKDKFFSIIAHDLRGPFSSIMGFSDLIVESVEKNNYHDLHKYTLIIQSASSQAMDLLTNLLVWARLQTGKFILNPKEIEIGDLVNNVISLVNLAIQRKSLKISHNITSKIMLVADREMLSNVIRNLISNAIKFSFPNGEINIVVTEMTGYMVFVVKDNGVGIEPDHQQRLFRIDGHISTRGTQNEEGTGLGLVLCKEFISQHGGTIWVVSEPGKGSNFCFKIPLTQ